MNWVNELNFSFLSFWLTLLVMSSSYSFSKWAYVGVHITLDKFLFLLEAEETNDRRWQDEVINSFVYKYIKKRKCWISSSRPVTFWECWGDHHQSVKSFKFFYVMFCCSVFGFLSFVMLIMLLTVCSLFLATLSLLSFNSFLSNKNFHEVSYFLIIHQVACFCHILRLYEDVYVSETHYIRSVTIRSV